MRLRPSRMKPEFDVVEAIRIVMVRGQYVVGCESKAREAEALLSIVSKKDIGHRTPARPRSRCRATGQETQVWDIISPTSPSDLSGERHDSLGHHISLVQT
jgi:hypothetical protein